MLVNLNQNSYCSNYFNYSILDCCSSRVLLAKDHDLKTIDEMSIVASSSTTPSPSIDTSPDDFLPQAQLEKYLQHIKAFINSIAINPNKTQYHNQAALNERNDYSPFDYSYQAVRKNNSFVADNGEATHPKHNININFHHQYHHYWQQMLQKQQQQQEQEQEVVGEENIADIEKKDSSLATLSTNQYVQRPVSMIRESNVDNINLHFDDVYYTIMKDVLSFACTGQFLTDFCLNKGRCFRYPVGNQSFFSCECADGYVGERCESKSVRG